MAERGAGYVRVRTAVGVGALVAVFGGATFVAGMYAARADPGGHTRRALTVAGTLTGAGSSAMVTFRFRKGAAVQCAPAVMVMPSSTGTFSAEVPMDQAGQVCPDALFDGSDVQVDVVVGGTTVVNGAAVNPVPYARYAEQVGTPDCPVGYERASDANFTGDMRLCVKRRADGVVYDEVVRVGVGPTAFWIDRYEASVWEDPQATMLQRFRSDGDFDATVFPRNGQWVRPYFALSRAAGGVSTPMIFPSTFITWFQAEATCRASGKRLAFGQEWMAAAVGTSDPGSNIGNPGPCRTNAGAIRQTGLARHPGVTETCVSRWGAEDMIGNAYEWTADWFSPAHNGIPDGGPVGEWTAEYRGDSVGNVPGSVSALGQPTPIVSYGVPAAILRGGGYRSMASAGVFAFDARSGPHYRDSGTGFRCVIPR